MNSLAGFVVHLAGVVTVVPLFGVGHTHLRLSSPELPDRWPLLALVVIVLVGVGLIRWAASLGRRLKPPLRSTLAALRSTMRNPRAAVALLVGAAGVTAGYIAALAAAGQVFGVQLPVATMAAVFLGGSAVAAVLVYRLITYWLPVLPGAVAFRLLRRQGTI
jgi:uncharacterized membrane protein YbhN (UPF0104 family)